MWHPSTTVGPKRSGQFGGISRREHVTPILRNDLHWLPVEHRIQFKISVMTYKALHELAPPYICDMCVLTSSKPALQRNRSPDRGDLIVPRTWTVTFDHRRCTVNFEHPTRRSTSLLTFRSGLKIYLFRAAYNISDWILWQISIWN